MSELQDVGWSGVTLPKDFCATIDAFIKGKSFSSRSEFIRYVCRAYMEGRLAK